jgi:predicted Fe-Mo cluster-binding NifX family protein
MSYKIAVASSDGVNIDLHFGRADQFHIVEVEDDGSFRFAEVRRNGVPVPDEPDEERGGCGGGGCKLDTGLIADCAYVFALRIGAHAYRSLAAQGITAFDLDDNIKSSVQRLIDYNKRLDSRKNKGE